MDWQQLILELRREVRTMKKLAKMVDLSADRLRKISTKGTKNMLWDNGNKIIELHRKMIK